MATMFLSIVNFVLVTVFVVAIYAAPSWLLLRAIRNVLIKRMESWKLQPFSALVRIMMAVFPPLLLLGGIMVWVGFMNLTGEIAWLDSVNQASPRDEAGWNVAVMLAFTWPFFLIYMIAGGVLSVRLCRRYLRKRAA